MKKAINPITRQDYPDPDIIRVDDTYYMVSTTMYFMPGGVILRSYDLVNWEIAAYVYDILEDTKQQRLQDGNSYGKGMWAASLRYHKGLFYICFVANDTQKTYLYTSKTVEGPWKKQYVEGFYHDCSLLFDDDDRVYIVYGNRDIYLTELKDDLSGPKPGGLHRMIVSDVGNHFLGYEGSHLYKIHGTYYLFMIHSLKTEWRRVEACFMTDSLEAEFVGGDVFNDCRGYEHQGVAQGGIVDTPDGDWYSILFQDLGAVGRIPILIPMHFEGKNPVLGVDGKVPDSFTVKSTRPGYVYESLYGSDDFTWSQKDGKYQSKKFWQWNHMPEDELWHIDEEKKAYCITAGKLCEHVDQAVNTLTQRMYLPGCSGTVTVDGSQLNNGDYAGICALQGCYGLIALHKEDDQYYLVMKEVNPLFEKDSVFPRNVQEEKETARIKLDSDTVTLKISADFENMKDMSTFYYEKHGMFVPLGQPHKLMFRLDHFTGCRFGLFLYATKEIGGSAAFSQFEYEVWE